MIFYFALPFDHSFEFPGQVPRWELFADILKVGVPGLINTSITNLSVVVLTGSPASSAPKLLSAMRWGEARLHHATDRLWLLNSRSCDGRNELGAQAV